MKKDKAFDSLATMIGDLFPIVCSRVDYGARHIGVAIDGIPVAYFRISTVGARIVDGIDLNMWIAGLSSETVPMFHGPPGQPPPLINDGTAFVSRVPIGRSGPNTFDWIIDPTQYGPLLRDAAVARWSGWRDRLVATTGPDLAGWIDNCERLLEREHPWRLLAQYGDAPLSGFSFPAGDAQSNFARFPMITLGALIGLAPVLPGVYPVGTDPTVLDRAVQVRRRLLDLRPR